MTFHAGESGNPGARVQHGFYKKRERTCDACGNLFTARKLTSRYCSNACRTQHGPWSFEAAHHAEPRVLIVTPRGD